MKLTSKLIATVALSVAALTAQAGIVWDQGPSTGTISGSWVNQTANQNFADKVNLGTDTNVIGLNYFTNFDLSGQTGSSDFHLKILSDSAGTPGAYLYQADLGYSNSLTLPGINEYQFSFANFTFLANTSYWIGLSGNGFEAAQLSVSTPQDGSMAMFSGSTFATMVGIGDQMFQLTSENSVPEPGSLALIGLGLAGVVVARRKAKQSRTVAAISRRIPPLHPLQAVSGCAPCTANWRFNFRVFEACHRPFILPARCPIRSVNPESGLSFPASFETPNRGREGLLPGVNPSLANRPFRVGAD